MVLQVERTVPSVVCDAAAQGGQTKASVLRAGWVAPEVEEKLTALEQYLSNQIDGGMRPARGRSVEITLDADDCTRIRTALRRMALEATMHGELLLAATALEVALEEVLAFLDGRTRPTPIRFDLADCALMACALLYVSGRFERSDADSAPFRTTALRLFERLSAADEEFVDVI